MPEGWKDYIEEFRRAGHELIDWIADYRARVARGEFPVMARTAPGALRDALPKDPPALSLVIARCCASLRPWSASVSSSVTPGNLASGCG